MCHEDVLFGVWCLFWLSDPENNKVSAPGGFSILEYSPNIYEGSANTNVYKCMIYVVYHSWISYVYKIWFSVCIQDILLILSLYLYVYMRYLSFVKTEMIPSYSQALLSRTKHLNNNPVRRLVTKTSLRRMARHWDDDGFFCSDFRIWLGCFLKASLVNVFFWSSSKNHAANCVFLKFSNSWWVILGEAVACSGLDLCRLWRLYSVSVVAGSVCTALLLDVAIRKFLRVHGSCLDPLSQPPRNLKGVLAPTHHDVLPYVHGPWGPPNPKSRNPLSQPPRNPKGVLAPTHHDVPPYLHGVPPYVHGPVPPGPPNPKSPNPLSQPQVP